MATAGSDSTVNTHPFLVDSMLVAHNGGFGDLAKVDAPLGANAALALGQTDSERYALLIAQETPGLGVQRSLITKLPPRAIYRS
jgi:predicted glutamine amidotransferase